MGRASSLARKASALSGVSVTPSSDEAEPLEHLQAHASYRKNWQKANCSALGEEAAPTNFPEAQHKRLATVQLGQCSALSGKVGFRMKKLRNSKYGPEDAAQSI